MRRGIANFLASLRGMRINVPSGGGFLIIAPWVLFFQFFRTPVRIMCYSPLPPKTVGGPAYCQFIRSNYPSCPKHIPKKKDPVSTENNDHNTQEQELWERMSTSAGVERAEVLDELSHIAYKKENYVECLQLLDTSIELYFGLGGAENYAKELIHLYQGKTFCLENLKRFGEAAEMFEELAKLHRLNCDEHGQLCATRSAGRAWYEIKEWEKSLEWHLKGKDLLDPDATPFTMGMDLINIGMALAKLDRHEEAVESYLGARKYFKEAKNPEYVNWCDNYAALSYIELGNGPEAKFHSQHYFNYCKVAEDIGMEAYARYRLGTSYLICEEHEEAAQQLMRALELLTMENDKDWEDIVAANKGLAKALVALGREKEANERLERIKTIEETMND